MFDLSLYVVVLVMGLAVIVLFYKLLVLEAWVNELAVMNNLYNADNVSDEEFKKKAEKYYKETEAKDGRDY